MKNSTFSAQVANNLLTVLQGYSKTIRLLLVMLLTLTVTTNAWAEEATLSFADKAQRTSFSTTKQVWVQNGVTFTNDKASSTNAVADYANPVRLYANSSITVECASGNMTKIVFNANTTAYASTLKTSIGNTATVSSKAVTVTLDGTSNTFTVKLSGQVRLDKITVTYTSGGGGSTTVDPEVTFSNGEYTIGGAALDLSTLWDSNSTGAVTYSVTNAGTTGATVNGTSFTATAAGTCTVQASQAATATHNAATATATITVSAPAGGGGGEGECSWVETAISSIKSTDIVVITMTNNSGTYAMSNDNGTGSAPTATKVTVSDTKLTGTIADNLKWNISNSNGTLTIYPNETTSTWLYCTSTNNGVRVGTNDNKTFAIDATSGYLKHVGTSRYLGVYNNADWRCYTNTTGNTANQTLKFYVYQCSDDGGDDPEPVIVKTLKSIAVTGMTTTFEQGDVFKFDGTCTATYSVTKDGAAQADETAEVTPTNVSTPDMNQIGTQTVYVTYSEGGVEKTDDYKITITENTVTAGEYCITPNNEFWGTNFNGSLSGEALNQTYTGRQDDITIQYAKGSSQYMYINDSQTRVYGNNSLTFSVPSSYVITAIAFTADGNNWNGTHTSNVGSMTDSKNWEGSAKEVTITFGGNCRITKICVTYEELDLTLPSAPTFTPAAGTYNAVQNVTISAEAGTTIYYTLDGTDPTTASNVYASAIEISETTTVKAIAVKDEKVSPIASATYTINLPLTTMDQIFAKATAVGTTATSVEITFGNWVVSAVKEDGKTAFVTDGTKGFVIYEVGCGFKVGDVLSGTAACKVLLYNGFAELTGLTSSTTGLTVSTGGTITTQELDAAGIAALTGVNTGSLIKINGICSSSDSKYYVADVQIYTSLYNFGTLEVGAEYNITGIYQPYNSTKEILPRSAADIEKVVGLPTATIAIADITMEVGEEKDIEATITPDAAQTKVQYAITAGSEYIDLDGTTITAVAAGTATITATIAEAAGEYYGTTKTFNVTVKPQNIAVLSFTFDGGKADIENTLGMSQTGLDDDYNSAPKLKFNGAGDNVIIHFDRQAGEFSFLLKQNGQNAGTFTVYESANGEDYTPVWSGGDFGNAQSETIKPTLSATARYVKFEYTTKGTSTNYALGSISIAKPDTRQEAGLAWNPTSVTLTQGDAFTAPTLQNPESVSGITYESSNTDVATVNDAGVIELAGETGEATITATFDGNEDYKPAEVSCTITVNALTTYTVTLNPNYPAGKTGVFKDKEENIISGNLEISLPANTETQPIANLYTSISLDGYIFEGWYEAADGDKHREKTGTITQDITFYAHWKVPYTVTFKAGTGNCATESITETTAKGITLPTATLTDCDDWVFLGWAEAAIESETTDAPASILYGGSTYKPTDDITLYAIYKRVEGEGGGEGTAAMLTFDNTSKRTTLTTEQQVWTENGITLTNNKASSISDVGNYANPARFYAKSEIIIEAPENITQIAATTSGGDEYINALKNSVGAEAISSDNVVTITPSTSSNTYTIQLTGGQTRLKSIAVTYGGNASTSYYHSTPNCQVTITYYGFGGGYTTDCETDPVIVITKGDTYQIPNCEPTDYDNTLNRTFAGTWNTKANGKGTAYKPGEEFIVNSDIILYAQWTLNTIGNTTLPTGEELLANTDIVVTGGNTLTLQAGTTTIKSLTLKGGIQSDGEYKMPIINIPADATLVRNNNKINLDLKVNNNSYYPFAVPFEVRNTSENVNYLDTTLKKYANANNGYGKKFYEILEYNGAGRAENGVHEENWVHVGRHDAKNPSYLVPGKGYAISAVPAAGKDTVTIRITMSVSNDWLANGEQFQIDTITRNAVKVVAHKGTAATEHQRHAGWNFVANPYLTNFTANENISGAGYINGKIIINDGNYSYGGDEVPYVTIPTYNFAHYYQVKLSKATLSPAYSFFVQVGTGGTMTFETAGRQAAPAGLAARSAEERPVKMDVDITLSDNHSSDQTGIIISDRYSDAYEIGRDLEKLFGSAYNLSVYTLMADNTPLAFQALAIRSNMQVIPVGYRAPEQGEYTFRLNEATSSIDLLNEQYEQLVLVDYQTGELTNLLISDYTFYSERTQADNRFAIYAVSRQNAPTDLPNAIGQDKQAQKIIHNGHLYILRDGNVYNGNGQIVK